MNEPRRFAVRTLRKRPAFAPVAVLTLALRIGANAATFSLVNRALYKGVPGYLRIEDLVEVIRLHDALPGDAADLRRSRTPPEGGNVPEG